MNTAEPWDGHEAIADALDRRGLKEVFDNAIAESDRDKAIHLMLAVGVDTETAADVVQSVLGPPKTGSGD